MDLPFERLVDGVISAPVDVGCTNPTVFLPIGNLAALYLKRWGFSAQKPLMRATQRDPQKIAAWLEKDYPSIAARAKREKAVIYWGDETGVNNQDQIGWGYAPEGRTPVLTQTGQRFSTSMIAAVSNRGLMRFKLYKGRST